MIIAVAPSVTVAEFVNSLFRFNQSCKAREICVYTIADIVSNVTTILSACIKHVDSIT